MWLTLDVPWIVLVVTNVMPSTVKERADEVLDKLQIMDPDERDLYRGAASFYNALSQSAKKDVVDGPSLEAAVDDWRSDNGECPQPEALRQDKAHADGGPG